MKDVMTQLGNAVDSVGLIHADLHLDNALLRHDDVRVIDFDDCRAAESGLGRSFRRGGASRMACHAANRVPIPRVHRGGSPVGLEWKGEMVTLPVRTFRRHYETNGGSRMGAITTTDGTEIFYKDWGSGQPIVFSHGWPLSGGDWDTQMLFFLQHGYRVIAHDRRGHGRSAQPSEGNDFDHYADDLGPWPPARSTTSTSRAWSRRSRSSRTGGARA